MPLNWWVAGFLAVTGVHATVWTIVAVPSVSRLIKLRPQRAIGPPIKR